MKVFSPRHPQLHIKWISHMFVKLGEYEFNFASVFSKQSNDPLSVSCQVTVRSHVNTLRMHETLVGSFGSTKQGRLTWWNFWLHSQMSL